MEEGRVYMLSIALGSISIILTGYILKKYTHHLAMFESEILSSLENEDDSSSCVAIMNALDNQQNIDK